MCSKLKSEKKILLLHVLYIALYGGLIYREALTYRGKLK